MAIERVKQLEEKVRLKKKRDQEKLLIHCQFFILYRNPNYRPPSQDESTEMEEQLEDDNVSVVSSDSSSSNDHDDSGLNCTGTITPSPTRTGNTRTDSM